MGFLLSCIDSEVIFLSLPSRKFLPAPGMLLEASRLFIAFQIARHFDCPSNRVRALTRFLPFRYALSSERYHRHGQDCPRLQFSY